VSAIVPCHSHSPFSASPESSSAQMFPFMLGHTIHQTTKPFQLEEGLERRALLCNHWLRSTVNRDLAAQGCGHSALEGWAQAQGCHNLSGQPTAVLHNPHMDFGFDSLSPA